NLVPGSARHLAAPAEIAGFLDLMIRYGTEQTPRSQTACARLLELVCLRLADAPVLELQRRSAARDTWQRCRQLLQDRFLKLASLDELAEACEVDPAYLCRLFRRFDQQSPYQLLSRMKMNQAATLLVRSALSVKQAAEAVGYVDVYHFSRVFRRFHGVSPGRFARAYRQGS
ncbi:MAG: helix-turn-helix transcriptional regulator, partial [Phycisphaeraceae bacterium]|nr:helix-turn-helix transcriptional regulator [Phycisphaeraceae bacterium]